MTGPVIETPRGSITTVAGGTKARLEWNKDFQPRHQQYYSRAQRFVDSEVLRGSEPFIPLLTGTLIKTGILGTYIGSGEVAWIAPYAKAQYYSPREPGSSTGPLRGPYWFERWKAAHGKETIKQARMIAGGSA